MTFDLVSFIEGFGAGFLFAYLCLLAVCWWYGRP